MNMRVSNHDASKCAATSRVARERGRVDNHVHNM
jgi:hypothetical protein